MFNIMTINSALGAAAGVKKQASLEMMVMTGSRVFLAESEKAKDSKL
jgi:hypothetical protein